MYRCGVPWSFVVLPIARVPRPHSPQLACAAWLRLSAVQSGRSLWPANSRASTSDTSRARAQGNHRAQRHPVPHRSWVDPHSGSRCRSPGRIRVPDQKGLATPHLRATHGDRSHSAYCGAARSQLLSRSQIQHHMGRRQRRLLVRGVGIHTSEQSAQYANQGARAYTETDRSNAVPPRRSYRRQR